MSHPRAVPHITAATSHKIELEYGGHVMYPRLQLGPIVIGTYGLSLLVAFIISWKALEANLIRNNLPGHRADWIIILLSVSGILGSKVYHVLESPAELLAHPSKLFIFTGGFAWFGGFLAGVLALCFLARCYKMPALRLLDLASPVAALGYSIGRLGCLFAGDGDYGVPTSLPWGMSFPNGIVPTMYAVHPTPIYEFLVSILIFNYLWRVTDPELPCGSILARYLVLAGAARFLVEFIRLNPRTILGLSNAQILSLLCLVVGLMIFAYNSPALCKRAVLNTCINRCDKGQPKRFHEP
jgi:phosphatidylglycerol:prolipoprotein diacylglycerol transferase